MAADMSTVNEQEKDGEVSEDEGKKKQAPKSRVDQQELDFIKDENIKILENEFSELDKKEIELQANFSQLEEDIQELKEESDSIKSSIADIIKYEDEQSDRRRSIEVASSIKEENSIKMNKIIKEREEMEKVFLEQETTLHQCIEKEQHLQVELETQLEELSQHKVLRDAKQRRVDELQDELDGLRGDHKLNCAKMRDEINRKTQEMQRSMQNVLASIDKKARKESRDLMVKYCQEIESENKTLSRKLNKHMSYLRELQDRKAALGDLERQLIQKQLT